MTANNPMTGEQLDELMTVAVNMQRDSEKAGDRPTSMFAYAVQVAVLELRKARDDAANIPENSMSITRYWISPNGIACENESGSFVKYDDCAALEQQLTESHRALRAETTAHENTQMQLEKLAAENAGLKAVCEDRRTFIMNGVELGYIQVPTVETDPALETIRVAVSPQEPTPATDAFLAEVRASAIPEGYVLVPQEMHLSSEAMEGICFHCGDGDHNFGEFTDGTLFVGDVDYGDGKKVHGLHIATADYPEEGCATICEFAAQLRKGVQS